MKTTNTFGSIDGLDVLCWDVEYGRGIEVAFLSIHTLATRSATKHGADRCELSLSFRDTFSRKHQVQISVPMHAITATRTHQGYV